MQKLFGTDGIRGVANAYPLTMDICIKLSRAVYKKFLLKSENKSVLIGKDTRVSGDIFEHTMAAAFCSMGVEVRLCGVVPTPAISILTQKYGFSMGIMISASHNPYYDNGIKLFNSKGLKLADSEELELEQIMLNDNLDFSATCEKIKQSSKFENASDVYVEKIINSLDFEKEITNNLSVVIDSANGSLSEIAPRVFKSLGFRVISLFDSPNGTNINENCGVTHPMVLSEAVRRNRADFGAAFDGDGDRVLLCDASGDLFNGDDILAILSLEGNHTEIVSTVMSNFGFEQYLRSRGINLMRTNVGDKHISEYMRNSSATLGGEPSGHIIVKSYAPTGDGLFVGLKVVEIVLKNQKQLKKLFNSSPTVSENVRVTDKSIIEKADIKRIIENYDKQLSEKGRLIVRASGTEPLIRITAEGENTDKLSDIVNDLARVIEECR